MMCGEHDSPNFIKSLQHGPYSSSLASSASASSASVWSDASSQSSDDTSISNITSDSSEQCDSYCFSQPAVASRMLENAREKANSPSAWLKHSQPAHVEVPPEMRQNPRRTSQALPTKSGCPPALVRQCDRKVNFVDSLVDSSTQIVEAIWPLSSVVYRVELGSKAVLPLRTFIQETLRRSRTSYSTLQVALYYLILIKPHVPKHDFTMEQPDDVHANRALQCGRRMFLAALILASKYLQDRNYSARAWSKISGLATHEINQNEMSFLLAVNWKLHITDEVFQRWTEIVLKYTPSQPPSPGSACSQQVEQQCQDWKKVILELNPELDNVGTLFPTSQPKLSSHEIACSPRSIPSPSRRRSPGLIVDSSDVTPTPRSYHTPIIMEPSPAAVHTPGRFAPALGLLPTPRLTPQMGGFSTPAVSAASQILSGKGSMCLAVTQAAHATAAQNLDRWPSSTTSSPQIYFSTRRSSLANSLSTASSPESMVSDLSRTSRSSSISSASSLVSAPYTKLDVQARCRSAKLCSERYSLRPAIASVPEDFEEACLTSSPELYTGPSAKDLCEMSLDTPLARQECDVDDAADAARALQELQNYHRQQSNTIGAAGSKRSRPVSVDNALQDNVRGILGGQYRSNAETEWPNHMLRSREGLSVPGRQQIPLRSALGGGRKRVCCSTENTGSYAIPSLHPAVGGAGGPGMWEGILN